MRFAFVGICALLTALVVSLGAYQAGQDKKIKIKDVMKQAHAGAKKSLLSKVASGKASEEEKTKLVALYVALSMNEPPKGDIEAWKKRTGTLVELAKKAEKGDAEALKALPQAAACMVCHKEHKGG
jgi:hypothetical protein